MREAQTKKIPYQFVLGDNEVANNTLNVRKFGSQEQKSYDVNEFVKMLVEEIKSLKR